MGRQPDLPAADVIAQALCRVFDLLGIAQITGAHEGSAAGAEGGARRHADAGLVDDPERLIAAVGDAVDLQESIKRAFRLAGLDAVGRDQRIAEDVARGAGALDIGSNELVAVIEGSYSALIFFFCL